MTVISIDEGPHRCFWRRLADPLDAYFVNRTRRVVPEVYIAAGPPRSRPLSPTDAPEINDDACRVSQG